VTNVDHHAAALDHLEHASKSVPGGKEQTFRLSAAGIHSNLAMAEAAQAQAEAIRAATGVNAGILAAFTQPAEVAGHHCASCDGHSCPDTN